MEIEPAPREAPGPQVYNQLVQDAREYVQEHLDDLDGEADMPETKGW